MRTPKIILENGGLEDQLDRSAHASESPMMVMVDESTGNKYMRALSRKGLGPDGDNSWLVKDMHQELKSWGHPGGGQNAIVLKSDSQPLWLCARRWQDATGGE